MKNEITERELVDIYKAMKADDHSSISVADYYFKEYYAILMKYYESHQQHFNPEYFLIDDRIAKEPKRAMENMIDDLKAMYGQLFNKIMAKTISEEQGDVA